MLSTSHSPLLWRETSQLEKQYTQCGLGLSMMLMVTQSNERSAQGKWTWELLTSSVNRTRSASFTTVIFRSTSRFRMTLSLARGLWTNIPRTIPSAMLLRLSICFSHGPVERRLATTIPPRSPFHSVFARILQRPSLRHDLTEQPMRQGTNHYRLLNR